MSAGMGTLYAVGVGPGDPELMTLKAVRILRESDVICVPSGKRGGQSVALNIARGVVDMPDDKLMSVHFPMSKGPQRDALAPAAQRILSVLREGRDVAFVTLGDPTMYSTVFHLLDAMRGLDSAVRLEIVPGVSSINAAAARAGVYLALADERVSILPATYAGSIGEALRTADTVVLMKVHSVLGQVREELQREGMLGRAIYVRRAGMPEELVKPLAEVTDEELDYFSIVIVRRRGWQE